MNRGNVDDERVITATFTKETAESKTGVAVGERDGKIVISNIVPGSLAAENADLCRGMEVVSINDTAMKTGMTSPEAAKLLIEAVGAVTIKALKPVARENVVPAQETETTKNSAFWCCN